MEFLKTSNVTINTGLYSCALNGVDQAAKANLALMYGDALTDRQAVNDFVFDIKYTSLLRSIVKPQVAMFLDGKRIFNPTPKYKSLPNIEWGMNWAIASYDNTKLLIHAGVAVKDNKAIIFPATQGSGKTTLSCLLGLSGWQVFSDELAIIETTTNKVLPIYRPACLKNKSIDIIRDFAPSSIMTDVTYGTQKGAVSHLKLNTFSAYKEFAPADIVTVVFPKYLNNTKIVIKEEQQIIGFSKLIKNSFNYSILGKLGFEVCSKISMQARFFNIRYSDFNEIESFLTEIVDE